jgi:hypothetical protein
MLFGRNPASGLLLAMLDLTPDTVGRFRDCYLTRGDSEERQNLPPPELAGKDLRIVVFTRNGGGNREAYESVIDTLRAHPQFIADYDDDFDCTYASFEFRVPKAFEAECKELEALPTEKEPMKKFTELIDKLKSGDQNDPAVKRAMQVGAQIIGGINDAIAAQKGGQS